MATELELKTVVADPAALRAALASAGATRTFRGMMRDRRLDRSGALSARDEVLRVRTCQPDDRSALLGAVGSAPGPAMLAWKGPTGVSDDGYKRREELECGVEDATAALALFAALGYETVQAIDRFVEVYQLSGTVVRLEWYPRMDVLAEIEGEPTAMEVVIERLGLSRRGCLPEPLLAFTSRYEARTGRAAVLDEGALAGELPSWRNP